jgi:hypothetical protein
MVDVCLGIVENAWRRYYCHFENLFTIIEMDSCRNLRVDVDHNPTRKQGILPGELSLAHAF